MLQISNLKNQCPDPAKLPVLRQGSKAPAVKLLQEWLSLNGRGTAIDGDFGPATGAALRAMFAIGPGSFDGSVAEREWTVLLNPMARALSNGFNVDYRVAVRSIAAMHLAAKAREVGGPNAGPWVRLYMDGMEGPDAKWCAGFDTFVLEQANHEVGSTRRPKRTFSCDVLANNAKAAGTFIAGAGVKKPKGLLPGDLFVVRGTKEGDWIHTGIATEVHEDHVGTIEGNSNDDGSPDGYMVVKRSRGYGRLDFIQIV